MTHKKRPKRSAIWTMSLVDFKKLVHESSSIADIVRHFGFAVTGKAHRSIKERIAFEKIDASHIPLGIASNLGRRFNVPKIPLKEVLVKNSSYDRKSLKKRVIDEGLLQNQCQICDQESEWQGVKLVMVLDHTNGVRDDNRLTNLRLLCPNCNSQQSTFSGRNKR